jgi:hypothetical protein
LPRRYAPRNDEFLSLRLCAFAVPFFFMAAAPASAADLAFLDGLKHLVDTRSLDRIDEVSKALGVTFVENKDGSFAGVDVRPAWLFQGGYARKGDPPGKDGVALNLSLTGCVQTEDVTSRLGTHYRSWAGISETFRKDGGITPQLSTSIYYDYPGKPSLRVVFDPVGENCFRVITLLAGPSK